MDTLIDILESKEIAIPEDLKILLKSCKSYTVYDTVDQLNIVSTDGLENSSYEVKYDIPGKGEVTEAIVHRVRNGISVNYPDPYMRRRDPDTMLIADHLPTDKEAFEDRFGYEFDLLKKETFHWLKGQDLAVFLYFAGHGNVGVGGIAVCPANAGFFAMALAMLQVMISTKEIPEKFQLDSVIYVAPTFRHTHFNGNQIVVHNRSEERHEIFSYNLYPGPSAKKGLYGALLTKGEHEGWITAHCSTVQVVSPYDNITTFMHEGASGGGKSEMHQHIIKEPDGQVLIGRNTITGDTRLITLPLFCTFNPVTDDMALCHPSYQNKSGKLRVNDAENSWFVRVDSVNQYGDDPSLEKITVNPKKPLLFLNIDSTPNSTALLWEHTLDAPGKPCPNPRVILPREIVPNVISHPVSVDVRSFGVRTPPSSRENPNYGIIGLFHVLPPALAWLWRLVAPRGHANPSITSSGGKMESEGVGSYWPFATGKRIDHANMLLKQIMETPETRYKLVPNQYIGVWKVGFKPQLLMREYLTRRGNSRLRPDQFKQARCPLLGYELNYLTIEGAKIPTRLLQVYKQDEVGTDGYDAGAEILYEFFKREIKQYLTNELHPVGQQIVEACLHGANVEDYENLLRLSFATP
ncbi:MAG: DUF4914 family protein [Porphyromonadaceae bacterium]|nr:DUF4914 family protein [Porphyromonadaceae bacterium]